MSLWWFTVSPYCRKVLGLTPPGARGFSMWSYKISLCLPGFSPGVLISFHSPDVILGETA